MTAPGAQSGARDSAPPPTAAAPPTRPRRIRFGIRARLLVVHAVIALFPLAGLWFARTYERELLRGEEEGMTAVATTLAAAVAPDAAQGPAALRPSPALLAAARAAAGHLRAQVRVIDAASGAAVLDTGPERLTVVTRGRELIDPSASPSSLGPPAPVAVGDPDPPRGDFRTRREVERALAGASGRATRVATRLRGVRLYVAEPVRAADGAVIGTVYVSRSTYPVLVSMYRVRNILVRVALASLVLAAALGSFLALTISRPLRKLTDGARRIAAGERGVELRLRGGDEVAELARAFDAMARELDARLSYISELAANVSHEFKTPIASVRGAAELLREGAADDPAARARFLANILADTDRLARLVTRLLELSRIEAHTERAVPVDYRALVEDVVARYRAAGLPVTLSYDARYSHLRGSAEHLESVLANLLDNARRFSPPGAPVAVRVALEPRTGALRTEVQDHGAGISPANLARVWDRFFTTARDEGGTGLGLAIVRAVVEAHGGEVGARSEPGQGSTFWFSVPRRL